VSIWPAWELRDFGHNQMEIDVYRPTGIATRDSYTLLTDGAYACQEGLPVNIVVRGKEIASAEVEGLALKPDDIQLISIGFETVWRYLPITFAGRVCCHLFCGEEQADVELDIAPAPDKLGQEAFEGMIRELDARAPGLPWGISPAQFQGIIGRQSTLVARPRVLEKLLPELERALRAFRHEPLYRAQQKREIRRMSHSRRPDTVTVRSLARTPSAAISLAAAKIGNNLDRTPVRVDQGITTITTDHPITQYMVGLLRRLKADLDIVVLYLDRAAGGEIGGLGDEVSRAYCRMLSEKVRAVLVLIVSALNRHPLLNVKPSAMTESVAQALPDHAPSMALHRIARRMLTSGLSPERHAPVKAGLRESWALYEYLVQFRLADTLSAHLGTDWSWSVGRSSKIKLLQDAPETGVVSLGNGRARLELRTQQTFTSTKTADIKSGFVSLAGMRIPDYVLGIFDHENRLRSWVILDAKFRTKKEYVQDSLGKIHIYRDGLRWDGLTAVSGYAIIPRILPDAILYANDFYHEIHDFGVLCCSLEPEEDWLAPILKWIDRVLE
jgi:hypothetical protein